MQPTKPPYPPKTNGPIPPKEIEVPNAAETASNKRPLPKGKPKVPVVPLRASMARRLAK